MSNPTKNNDAVNEKDEVVKPEVPAQKNGQADDVRPDHLKVLDDVIAAVQAKKNKGMTVEITLDKDGKIQIQLDRTKNVATKAKDLFRRNKKMALATGGLLATSVLLKVLANRQAALEAEIVESSDDVSTDA